MIVLIILTLTILQTYITLMNQYRISTLLVIIFCSIIIKRIKYELFIDDTPAYTYIPMLINNIHYSVLVDKL